MHHNQTVLNDGGDADDDEDDKMKSETHLESLSVFLTSTLLLC